RHQRPVEYLARPTRHPFYKGIKQNRACPGIARHFSTDIFASPYPQRFVPGPVKAFAIGRSFISVKLQHIQSDRIEGFVDFTTGCVDEQSDGSHKGRQRSDDFTRLDDIHSTRAFAVEDQADSVRSGLSSHKRVCDIGDPTYLATDDRQRQIPARKASGW